MDFTGLIEDYLRRVEARRLRRREAALWEFAEALYAWLYELFAHPYPGWQESFEALLAEQAAAGRTLVPESRQAVEDFIESHFAATQTENEHFASLGRSGTHPSNEYLSFSLLPGTGLTEDDLVLAHDIALLTAELRYAIDAATQGLEDPGLLASINPLGDDGITQVLKIAEMKAALSELELLYTVLGYDEITWSRFAQAPRKGIAGAEAHVPFAGPAHGIRPVTVETFMTAWGAASLASLGGKLLARGLGRLALRARTRGVDAAAKLREILAGRRGREAIPREILTREIEFHPGKLRRMLLELDDEARARLAPQIEEEMGLDLTGSRGVWDLGPATRGEIISERLGENLPAGFKTIDRFERETVTSIKSLDLWSETYRDILAVERVGKRYIDKVAEFSGGRRSSVIITSRNIRTRALDLAVPSGITPAQQHAITELVSYGRRNNVMVRIVEISK